MYETDYDVVLRAMLVCEIEIVAAGILAKLRLNGSIVEYSTTTNGFSGREQGNIDTLSRREYTLRYSYVRGSSAFSLDSNKDLPLAGVVVEA